MEETMEENRANTVNRYENIKNLRRYLNLTQKDFISQYLTDASGRAYISVATLSNIEARGGVRENDIIRRLSDKIGISEEMFLLERDVFFDSIPLIITPNKKEKKLRTDVDKKRNISYLVSRLTSYFAQEMLSGNLQRGDRIEADRILATRFGVGRSAIREGLKVLEILGMLEIKPGNGTFIANHNSNFFMIPLAWTMFLNGKQTESILELRDILEIKAAELAAKNADVSHIAHLHDISYRMYESYKNADMKNFLHEDLEFHSCIAMASGNEIIYSMIQTIRNLMGEVSQTGMVSEEQLRAICEEHQKIYGCILLRDVKASGLAMSEHMEHSRKRYDY